MSIHILGAATVGLIAAGEVVERPSSVAKELIENALDAGSTSITVEIRDGGTSYLRVTDNGCGIAPNEVRLAFANHATSKLRDEDDLTGISTLGFRGEALPSIAAVSRVELITRQRAAQSGVKIRVEGGAFVSLEEAGCPEGTTIIVRDLFYNTPARRAFLKKPQYEAGLLTDMVTRLALGNPGTAIRLINNARTVCHSFGDGNLRHAALAVYGRETASELIEIDEASGGLRISGLIGIGKSAVPNRMQQSIFINRRLVRCPLLTQAIEAACAGRVMAGTHPMCALHVQIPPQSVDVNVHPNKLEVRFRDEAAMRESAQALLVTALSGQKMLDVDPFASESRETFTEAELSFQPAEGESGEEEIAAGVEQNRPDTDRNPTEVSNVKTVGRFVSVENDRISPVSQSQTFDFAPPYPLIEELNETQTAVVLEPPQLRDAPEADDEEQTLQEYRVIGSAMNTYLMVEHANALIIIDQHAAHERLLYERYRKMLDQGIAAQQLLTPVILRASAREIGLIVENANLLREAGYDVEPFGARDVQVRSVPLILGRADMKMLFSELIEQLDQLKSAEIESRRGEIIQFSCKKAVKAGDRLTEREISALITDMRASGAPPCCPHGRPVLQVFRQKDLERMFRRV